MELSPIITSLKTAGVSIMITFFLGIFAARAVAFMKNQKAKLLWDGILTLPLVLPPTVWQLSGSLFWLEGSFFMGCHSHCGHSYFISTDVSCVQRSL